MKLDFICVGMYRSGTTWFHSIMQNHPDVILPYEKETMFFSHHYHRGIKWYAQFFKGLKSNSVAGEICPTYLTGPLAAKRIHAHFPDVKILMILRDPVGQITSLYKLWRTRGATTLDINEAFLEKENLIDNVMYYRNLRNYLDYFGGQQVKILFYDDLVKNPEKFIAAICRELTIDFSALENENFNRRINTSDQSTLHAVETFIAKASDYMRRNNLFRLRRLIKQTKIINFLKIIPPSKGTEPHQTVVLNDHSMRLLCDRILPEVENLQRLVNKDLSHWVTSLKCGKE